MAYQYAVIGSGRQGTAAAYDLTRFVNAERIVMVDRSLDQAVTSSKRIDQLTHHELAVPVGADAGDLPTIHTILKDHQVDTLISGTPYAYKLGIT